MIRKRIYTKEQRDFVEKDQIEKYLACPICQEIYDEPIRITCGHTFCKACLTQWENKSQSKLCALCRKEYKSELCGKDLTAQSIINDSIVRCIFEGCPWKDKLANLLSHIQKCKYDIPEYIKKNNIYTIQNVQKEEKEEEEEKKKKNGSCSCCSICKPN